MRFENTKVFNFENAFRGMRNPKDSWDKSDSFDCKEMYEETGCCMCDFPAYGGVSCEGVAVAGNYFAIGPNDL